MHFKLCTFYWTHLSNNWSVHHALCFTWFPLIILQCCLDLCALPSGDVTVLFAGSTAPLWMWSGICFSALGSNGLVARPVFHDYFSMTQPVVTARWEEKDWEVKMAAVASGGWRWVTGLPSFTKPALASLLGAIYRETAFKLYFLHLYSLVTVTYSTETAECTTTYKTYFIEWNDTFSLCAKGKKNQHQSRNDSINGEWNDKHW